MFANFGKAFTWYGIAGFSDFEIAYAIALVV